MPDDQELSIPIRFTMEEARRDLESAASEAKQHGRDIGSAAENAGGGFDSLREKLIQFGHHQRAEHREARIFALTLGQVLPESAKALGAALGAFAIGGPVALGFEAVKLAVEHFTEQTKQAEDAAKKLGAETLKSVQDTAKQLRASIDAAFDGLAKKGAQASFTEAEKVIAAQLEALNKAGLDLDAKIEEQQRKIRKAGDDALQEDREQLEKLLTERQNLASQAHQALQQAEAALAEERKRLRVASDIEFSNAVIKAEKEAAAARAQAAAAHEKQIEQMRRQALLAGLNETERAKMEFFWAAEKAGGDARAVAAQREILELKLVGIAKKEQAEEFEEWEKKMTSVHRSEVAERKLIDEQQKEQMKTLIAAIKGPLAEEDARYEKSIKFKGKLNAEMEASTRAAFGSMAKALGDYLLLEDRSAGVHKATAAEAIAAAEHEVAGRLAAKAEEAAVEALLQGAYAVAALAAGNLPGAAAYGTAAAEFAAVAVAAGGAAKVLDSTRGNTASENESHSRGAGGGGGGGPATPGATRAGEGGSSGFGGGGGTTTTVVVFADPLDTPQEALAKFARRSKLAKDLDLVR